MTIEHSIENGTEPVKIPLQLGEEYRISVVYDRPTENNAQNYLGVVKNSLVRARGQLSKEPTRLKSNGRLRPLKEYRRILRQREDHLAKIDKALNFLEGKTDATLRVIEQFSSDGIKKVVGFQILYKN